MAFWDNKMYWATPISAPSLRCTFCGVDVRNVASRNYTKCHVPSTLDSNSFLLLRQSSSALAGSGWKELSGSSVNSIFIFVIDSEKWEAISSCSECHLFINRWPVNWLVFSDCLVMICGLPTLAALNCVLGLSLFALRTEEVKAKRSWKVVQAKPSIDQCFFSCFVKKSGKLYFSPNEFKSSSSLKSRFSLFHWIARSKWKPKWIFKV